MTGEHDEAAAAAVDQILRQAGLNPLDEERERLVLLYPALRQMADRLRLPSIRYVDLAPIDSLHDTPPS